MGIVHGYYPIPAEYGQRVRFHRCKGLSGRTPELRGEGIFELAWLGIEECWNVRTDDGKVVYLHPCFGDTMEPVD